jgi:hypothetical protein
MRASRRLRRRRPRLPLRVFEAPKGQPRSRAWSGDEAGARRRGRARGASPIPAFVNAFPQAAPPLAPVPQTRSALEAALDQVRTSGFSLDTGQIHANIRCIARAWPTAGLPAAISCIGGHDQIISHRAAIEASLIAATEPGATAQDVVRAAATG